MESKGRVLNEGVCSSGVSVRNGICTPFWYVFEDVGGGKAVV